MAWVFTDSIRGPKGDQGDPADDSAVAGYLADDLSASITQLKSAFPILEGKRGFTQTIYVSASGNDSNDGKTSGTAFREIRTAMNSIAPRGPVFRGTTDIVAGPGSYKPGINFPSTRNPSQDDFIRITGPVVTHPNAPTAVIDYSLDTSVDYGIRAFDGATLMMTNLKFVGAFRYAVDARRGSYLHFNNVHGTGPGKNVVETRFFGALDYVNYYMVGGVITDWWRGIQEHGQVRRHFENVSSLAEGTQIKRCDVGLFAKEGCGGHLDYLQVEDCRVGVRFHTMCNANMLSVSFKRNEIPVWLTDSEIHNEGSIIYGTGADANGLNAPYEGGGSTMLGYLGWEGDNETTMRTGHRPLYLLAQDYAAKPHSGTLSETELYAFTQRLKGGLYGVKGKRFEVQLVGLVNVSPTTSDGMRVILKVAGQFSAEVKIPQGAIVGTAFQIVFTVLCTADGNFQKSWGTLVGVGNSGATVFAARTHPLSDPIDRTVAVSAIAGDMNAAVTFQVCELKG